jgi:cyanate permease
VGGVNALLVPLTARAFGWIPAIVTATAFAFAAAILWLWIDAGRPPPEAA